MKKVICLLLTLVIVFSLPLTAFAATNQASQDDDIVIYNVNPENVVFSSSQREPINLDTAVRPRGIYYPLEFSGYNAEVVVLADQPLTHTSSGTIYLEINTCTWAPSTNKIQVGFYLVESGTCYGRTLSGGTCSGTYSYANLPAGTYYVYATNLGPGRLTTGAMYYACNE